MRHLYNNIINNSLETNDIDFKNKTIIVVHDGAATGSTIIAATWSVRKNMDPKRLIIAIPISPKGTINKLKNEDIDQIEVITSPQNRNFVSIEQYYQHYDQITDKQVTDII
jgi:putative phosphoribosyl transferase